MKKDQMQREIEARDFLIKSREGEVKKLRAKNETDSAKVEVAMYYLVAALKKMGETIIEFDKQDIVDAAKAKVSFEITESGSYRFTIKEEEPNE